MRRPAPRLECQECTLNPWTLTAPAPGPIISQNALSRCRIPPYFALIIRAISVLEGIALTGDPEFAIVDEAYPYVAKRLLTDNDPRLQAALRYMARPCLLTESQRARLRCCGMLALP